MITRNKEHTHRERLIQTPFRYYMSFRNLFLVLLTDLARLTRCLLYGKEENFNSFNVTGLLPVSLQTEMSLT